MAGTFELKKAANGQYMFNLKAGNGEIVLTSETLFVQGRGRSRYRIRAQERGHTMPISSARPPRTARRTSI